MGVAEKDPIARCVHVLALIDEPVQGLLQGLRALQLRVLLLALSKVDGQPSSRSGFHWPVAHEQRASARVKERPAEA